MKNNGHPLRVFEGTVGGKKYLFDIGDGHRVTELRSDESRMEAAERLHAELVARKDVNAQLLRELRKQWAEARKH